MLTFYLIAGGLALLAAILLVRPLIGIRQASGIGADDSDVFRDQLTEIERDLRRGTVTAEEAEGARVEISRRLLAADGRARAAGTPGKAPQWLSGLMAGIVLIGTPALATAVYFGLGAPGMPDQPLAERLASRPGQEEAEAAMAGRLARPAAPNPRFAELVTKLEKVVAERPDDIRGQRLLAGALMNLGRYGEAWRAYDRVIDLSDGTAGAALHAAKAEGMIMAAGGYVSPEAEAVIARALEIDPALPMARYYSGIALYQAGNAEKAVAVWQKLRADAPAGARYLPRLDALLAEAGRQDQAGPSSVRPPAAETALPSGPTEAQIAAARQMSPEDRAAMINGMVTRLETRLSEKGGSAAEWLRLIDAYMKLERPDDAVRAYDLAVRSLGEGQEAGLVREQALLMGVPIE